MSESKKRAKRIRRKHLPKSFVNNEEIVALASVVVVGARSTLACSCACDCDDGTTALLCRRRRCNNDDELRAVSLPSSRSSVVRSFVPAAVEVAAEVAPGALSERRRSCDDSAKSSGTHSLALHFRSDLATDAANLMRSASSVNVAERLAALAWARANAKLFTGTDWRLRARGGATGGGPIDGGSQAPPTFGPSGSSVLPAGSLDACIDFACRRGDRLSQREAASGGAFTCAQLIAAFVRLHTTTKCVRARDNKGLGLSLDSDSV